MVLNLDVVLEAGHVNEMIGQNKIATPPLIQRRPPAKSLHYYEENYQDRKRGMVEAYRTGDYTMKDRNIKGSDSLILLRNIKGCAAEQGR